ncbi:MAG TPA: tripartite tricarboxylate transporter TctB family protein [Geminicoccaceae bacterium]|nr:tripartite tricarboxylate transporter TctB family protein [Geminicoccaceae bacterium]
MTPPNAGADPAGPHRAASPPDPADAGGGPEPDGAVVLPPTAPQPPMTRADFITGLAFVALGLAVLVESLRMPRLENLNVNPYTVPGLVPGILGLIILLLGAALTARAARAGGWRRGDPRGGALAAALREPAARRVALSALLTLAYAGGLVGRVPFWLATGLFVFAFTALFEWPRAATRAGRWRNLAVAAALAVATSAAVSWVFRYVFLVRLP